MLVSTLLPNYNVLTMDGVNGKHLKIWEERNTNQYAVSLESLDFTEIFHFDSYDKAKEKYIALLNG